MKHYLNQFQPIIFIEMLIHKIAHDLNELFSSADDQYYAIDENQGLVPHSQLSKAIHENHLVCTRQQFKRHTIDNYLYQEN
jgi:hypothetical protein